MKMEPMNQWSRILRYLSIPTLSTTDHCGVWTYVPAVVGVVLLLIVLLGIPAIL